jgi:RNA recognition motif-containing protein
MLPEKGMAMANRVYVRNLASGATEESVRNAFARTGTVSAVQLIKDRDTGDARGFAFVTMSSAEEATMAITAMNGTLFDGRALRVSRAIDRVSTRPGALASRAKDK